MVMKTPSFRPILLAAALLLAALPARAADHTIYVAPKGSPAYAVAEGQADNKSVFAERTLHRALDGAAKLLARGGSVRILIAGGEYDGKAGAGVWALPSVNSPEGTLHILGGWNDDFSERRPFEHLTRLVTRYGRGGAFLSIGQRSQLKALVISGLVMDAKPSNSYDGDMNLLKSGTSTWRLISFGQLKTDRLVIADNVFANAPQVVFDPYISAATGGATVEIVNNFFLGNVIPIQELSGVPIGRAVVQSITLRNNTFVSNWPYNPDPTSSNVGAVGLYHSGGVQHVIAEGNVFAYNVGGAFQHDWPEDRMPKLTLRGNLFFQNATLFGVESDGDGVFVGKFGPNPRYLVLDVETIEDDFGYATDANVAMDPGFSVDQMLYVEIDDEDPYADHYIEGYGTAMEVEPGSLPFAEGGAAGYGVQADACWAD